MAFDARPIPKSLIRSALSCLLKYSGMAYIFLALDASSPKANQAVAKGSGLHVAAELTPTDRSTYLAIFV